MRWIEPFEKNPVFPDDGEEAVRWALGNLGEVFGLPLWLSLGLQMSHAEISEVLSSPPDCVKKNIDIGGALLQRVCECVGVATDLNTVAVLLGRMASEPAPASLLRKLAKLTKPDADARRRKNKTLGQIRGRRPYPFRRAHGIGIAFRSRRDNNLYSGDRMRFE